MGVTYTLRDEDFESLGISCQYLQQAINELFKTSVDYELLEKASDLMSALSNIISEKPIDVAFFHNSLTGKVRLKSGYWRVDEVKALYEHMEIISALNSCLRDTVSASTLTGFTAILDTASANVSTIINSNADLKKSLDKFITHIHASDGEEH